MDLFKIDTFEVVVRCVIAMTTLFFMTQTTAVTASTRHSAAIPSFIFLAFIVTSHSCCAKITRSFSLHFSYCR